MKAHAAVATAPRRVEYAQVDVPDPGPGDVVVRVTHSWISNGTDGSFTRGERTGGDTPWREGDPLPFPNVVGYQKVGVVEWIGSEVADLRVGETVFATMAKVNGMFASMGGHVSPAVTPAHQIWRIPAGLPPLAVSGLVLTQVGYNCGTRAPVHEGDAAVVIGDGMVGNWSAQTLRHGGCRVMLTGKYDRRLALFRGGEGDLAVNVRNTDVLARVREWAPDGVHVVVDTVGSIPAVESFYPVMRGGAHIVSAGFYGTEGLIDIQAMRLRELSLHCPSGWSQERMDRTLELVASGVLETEHMITHHFPAEQADAAFRLVNDGDKDTFLGVVLDWTS